MAKVAVVFEDVVRDGVPGVQMSFVLDRQGAGKNDAATIAMAFGLAVKKLADNKALDGLVRIACANEFPHLIGGMPRATAEDPPEDDEGEGDEGEGDEIEKTPPDEVAASPGD